MKKIFLDNAATTQPSPEVIEAMDLVNEKFWGNPSSIHTFGQEAKKIVDEGRRTVADFVGCEPEEIIFTGGGSESDNLAIRGLINAVIASGAWQSGQGKIASSPSAPRNDNRLPHVITSAVEHHAVLHTIQELEKEGLIEATYIRPDSNGLITPEMVEKEIRDNTVLISLIYVNNETGVMTPIKEITQFIRNKEQGTRNRKNTRPSSLVPRPYFHTDAVQAAEFLNINPDYLGVDLLTFTAHKLHGPKGVGALYIKKGTLIKPEITGGGQEFGKRAGTENAAGIAGFAKALELIVRDREDRNVISTEPKASGEIFRFSNTYSERRQEKDLSTLDKSRSRDDNEKESRIRNDIEKMRDKLVKNSLAKIPNSELNGAGAPRAPHIANISFINAEGEAIILNLDFLGIAVSSGSACTSKSLEPSHVLLAMGIPPEKAHGSVRFSLSRYTTKEEIDKVIEVLPGIILKLRQMSPFK